MIHSNKKLFLLCAVIVFSVSLIVWLLIESDKKENFVIETSIGSDTYLTTKMDEDQVQETVSLIDGIPDGYGVITNPDGSVYVGNFINGQSHGKGKITYPGGASYEGEFNLGIPHGKGVCTYSSGKSEDCVFLIGQRQ